MPSTPWRSSSVGDPRERVAGGDVRLLAGAHPRELARPCRSRRQRRAAARPCAAGYRRRARCAETARVARAPRARACRSCRHRARSSPEQLIPKTAPPPVRAQPRERAADGATGKSIGTSGADVIARNRFAIARRSATDSEARAPRSSCGARRRRCRLARRRAARRARARSARLPRAIAESSVRRWARHRTAQATSRAMRTCMTSKD